MTKTELISFNCERIFPKDIFGDFKYEKGIIKRYASTDGITPTVEQDVTCMTKIITQSEADKIMINRYTDKEGGIHETI